MPNPRGRRKFTVLPRRPAPPGNGNFLESGRAMRYSAPCPKARVALWQLELTPDRGPPGAAARDG
ncbi:MAG TPA: hypothetical protein PKC18_09290, partial [Lacipirellulaceae bacterium]|nr:hypothetical protein [Lacipirellulaceae bacterium]